MTLLRLDGTVAPPDPIAAPASKADAVCLKMWSELQGFQISRRQASRSRLILDGENSANRAVFDMLRTKIAHLLRQNGWKSLAISSPGPGCGKTTLAMNLALGLARQANYRVVLVDLDLRRPSIAHRLGLSEEWSLIQFLRRKSPLDQSFVRFEANLAVAPNTHAVPDASEVLQDPLTGAVLADMREWLKPDVIIYDIPPMLTTDDLMAFLPWVESVLLVAAAEATTLNEIDRCERDVSANTNLLGVVLNKCRYRPESYGY
ncbi:CpsD/CapB family tyrosine-protein kinase [Pelagibacterium sp. H642]|uniref:CpsD/CapB family tyrosine-protein kinase n=1 Tax=Pelagibacterium sp. H642 TaxID=1881069 RepID=UPI0028162E4A|nr:CpsD/CapB family tyrosine-protein kinase [Pelagibacterium sp. H642]WMT92842.1 CpsD/CapB family tyrosine-protein kinase [Pelagibacterium sp. H642]